MCLCLIVLLYSIVAGAIWADDKSWGSLAVGLLWPVFVGLLVLELVFE